MNALESIMGGNYSAALVFRDAINMSQYSPEYPSVISTMQHPYNDGDKGERY